MSWKEKAAELLKKYKHAWVFCYALIYMPWFMYLEKHVTTGYHVIHSAIDDKIPFIEYFVIPYLFWFIFIAAVFFYFFFTDVEGFYRLAALSFAGMTIFLIICTVYPNGLHLRPLFFQRDNWCVDLVRLVYKLDTPTNVLPSLHVYNTLAACIAISRSKALKAHPAVCSLSYVTAGLIIMATVFLKQHSVIDVMAAVVMVYALYSLVYVPESRRVPRTVGRRTAALTGK